MPNHASSGITVHLDRIDDRCVVAPAPEVKEQLIDQFERLRNGRQNSSAARSPYCEPRATSA